MLTEFGLKCVCCIWYITAQSYLDFSCYHCWCFQVIIIMADSLVFQRIRFARSKILCLEGLLLIIIMLRMDPHHVNPFSSSKTNKTQLPLIQNSDSTNDVATTCRYWSKSLESLLLPKPSFDQNLTATITQLLNQGMWWSFCLCHGL